MIILATMLPLSRRLLKGIERTKAIEQHWMELLREYESRPPEEERVPDHYSSQSERAPIEIRPEELRYLWTVCSFMRHPLGREALYLAGMLFASQALLLVNSVIFQPGLPILQGFFTLFGPLLIIGSDMLFYWETAPQEHWERRLREERPWLFHGEE